MAFAGKFKLERREGYGDFAAASGATPDQIQKGEAARPTTEISVSGDTYTVNRVFPHQTTTNTFTLGVPTELNLVEGRKAKATVTLEGGKLCMRGEKFCSIAEIEGGNLKETLTFNNKTMTRWSGRC